MFACSPSGGELSDDERSALWQLQDHLKLDFARGLEPVSEGPAVILPHLLLGSAKDAQSKDELKQLGVTHVLNCAGGKVRTGRGFYEDDMEYDEFTADDADGYPIMRHYHQLETLADAAKQAGGRLFVHCEAGVNRSGSLCIAYHAQSTGIPLVDSARKCKESRGRICTNTDFQVQLLEFARARRMPLQ
jgi:hypothetical protein